MGERTSAEGPLLAPFAGLRAAPGDAQAVAAPPYDVLSTREARAAARDRPWSFLHVSRPEIDLPAPPGAAAPGAAALYAGAAAAFSRMIEAGVLLRDPKPRFYAYRMADAGGASTGLVAAALLAAYARGRIKRHEATRPAKVRDRARHIAALGAQTGPVLLLHRADDAIRRALAAACDGPPLCRCVRDGAVTHTLWPIDDDARTRALTRGFDRVGPLYIADGHHRTEAARAAAGGAADARFLCVSFPSDEVRILGYHRIVRDLNGLPVPAFLDAVREAMRCAPAGGPVTPGERRRFGMYVDGRWYGLAPARAEADETLDVSLLSRLVLEPILGIGDPREDPRIDFVGGGRGPAALAEAVDGGAAAVAFSLHPPTVEALMAVADAGATMPPKSTWFEPKLADGLVSLITGDARRAA